MCKLRLFFSVVAAYSLRRLFLTLSLSNLQLILCLRRSIVLDEHCAVLALVAPVDQGVYNLP